MRKWAKKARKNCVRSVKDQGKYPQWVVGLQSMIQSRAHGAMELEKNLLNAERMSLVRLKMKEWELVKVN